MKNSVFFLSQASDLYQAVKLYREAINTCIQGDLWPQARSIASELAPKYVHIFMFTGVRVIENKLKFLKINQYPELCFTAFCLFSYADMKIMWKKNMYSI